MGRQRLALFQRSRRFLDSPYLNQKEQEGRAGYTFGLMFKDFSVDFVALWVDRPSKLYLIPAEKMRSLLEIAEAKGDVAITKNQWLVDVDPYLGRLSP